MEVDKIISQLESIKENSESFITDDEPDSIWVDDVKAIDAAIEPIKGKGNKLEVLGNLAALEMIKGTQHELQMLTEVQDDEH